MVPMLRAIHPSKAGELGERQGKEAAASQRESFRFPCIVGVHCDLQGNGLASLEAHLNEASAIMFCRENRVPGSGIAGQHQPPELANV